MIHSILKAPIKGKRVLVRTDFNVPIQNQHILNNSRIRAALPTLKYILSKKPKQLIIMSHLGRPDGKIRNNLRMKPIATQLTRLLHQKVYAAPSCIGIKISTKPVVLLENLRFYPEEEQNNKQFAKQLASLADIYVNDAFGSCHRPHASIYAITKYIPSFAGLLLKKEMDNLSIAIHPKKPYLAIIGGGKPDKISLLKGLLNKADWIFVGGILGNILLAARGKQIGSSTIDLQAISLAKHFAHDQRIILPIDAVVATNINAIPRTCYINEIKPKEKILDIGPATVSLLKKIIKKTKTILWAGPLGAYEHKAFLTGTQRIAQALAQSPATTIVGGGDSATILYKLGLENNITYISTGGGASIEYLEGKKLPGITALQR
ncbi:MAG: phosphoglycerate kinase [Nanoarchaeota archaeon]